MVILHRRISRNQSVTHKMIARPATITMETAAHKDASSNSQLRRRSLKSVLLRRWSVGDQRSAKTERVVEGRPTATLVGSLTVAILIAHAEKGAQALTRVAQIAKRQSRGAQECAGSVDRSSARPLCDTVGHATVGCRSINTPTKLVCNCPLKFSRTVAV